MAHIANRSRFRVTVKNRPDLTRHFSFDKVTAVEAYMGELRAQRLKPKVVQLDESWLVRIRDKGHKPLEATFGSEAAATQFVDKTTEERKRGLFIDYTAALKVTFADLLVRYLLDEAWKTKSGQVLAYTLEGWLEDSGPRGVEMLQRYREEQRARGRHARTPKFKMRQSSNELAWIHKRLAEITTVDIEDSLMKTLRTYLGKRSSRILEGDRNPQWAESLQQHKTLLSEDPCMRYGGPLLAGDHAEVDELREVLNISDSSWFMRKLYLAQVRAAVRHQAEECDEQACGHDTPATATSSTSSGREDRAAGYSPGSYSACDASPPRTRREPCVGYCELEDDELQPQGTIAVRGPVRS